MRKMETVFSNRWILNLRKEFSARGNRIRINKIHGEAYQKVGMSDYNGLININTVPEARGRFIAIEFKVDGEEVKKGQLDYLVETVELGGLGIIIRFTDGPSIMTEYNTILDALFNRIHHPLEYFFDKNDYR